MYSRKFSVINIIINSFKTCVLLFRYNLFIKISTFNNECHFKKLKNRITNVHLDQTMRLALSPYEQDYEDIAKSQKCQISH